MFEHTLRKMRAFPLCIQVAVTRFEEIERAAEAQGMLVVENWEPDLGISHSLRLGLQESTGRKSRIKRCNVHCM